LSDWPLVECDAGQLPCRSASIDKVVCLEALYYFPDAEEFAAEVRRVLRPNGVLVLSVVNPRRPGFIESPGATRYWTPEELWDALEAQDFDVTMSGAFDWSGQRRAVTIMREQAARFHLIPSNLKARAFLKRILGSQMQVLADALLREAAERVVPLGTKAMAKSATQKVILVRAHLRNRAYA
jgi:ubiquinone/menaquinone biosynthesis C-methylase UbiE